MKSPAIVMMMSFPNPATACGTVSTLVRIKATTKRIPTTSTGNFSVANRTIANMSRVRVIVISVIVRKEYPKTVYFERVKPHNEYEAEKETAEGSAVS
ncbi:hypothetical protein JVX88_01465 [Leptolyngbya sp. 7M]|nr:hypothetical protein [Leptolyngbya sp. 7M]QYO68923.1 hypothetical protein JVX88_01465 [Leptolyngbya sp. 7M]